MNSPHECSRPQLPMGFDENLCCWLGVTKSYLSNGLLVVPLPNSFECSQETWGPYFYRFCLFAHAYFSVKEDEALDLTFRGTQAVPQVMPCFHGFPVEGICPAWF